VALIRVVDSGKPDIYMVLYYESDSFHVLGYVTS